MKKENCINKRKKIWKKYMEKYEKLLGSEIK